jgi:hypothetical protein
VEEVEEVEEDEEWGVGVEVEVGVGVVVDPSSSIAANAACDVWEVPREAMAVTPIGDVSAVRVKEWRRGSVLVLAPDRICI